MITKDTLLSNDLFGDLNPKDWPISIHDLPPGSALVGGSVRDGLLKRLSQKNVHMECVQISNKGRVKK